MENERFFSDHIDFPQGLFPPQTLTFFVWFLIFNIEFDFFVKNSKREIFYCTLHNGGGGRRKLLYGYTSKTAKKEHTNL